MKSIYFGILLCLPVFTQGQYTFTNEKVYYGYEKSFNELFFIDSTRIFTTAGLQPFYLWNSNTGKIIEEVKIPRLSGGFAEASMNSDNSQIGVGVSNCVSEESYTTVLQFYNTKSNTIENIKFKDLDIVRFVYHPTDKKRVAVIAFDEDFESISAILNLETKEIETICFQGKGKLMPLYHYFTPDGNQLIIGYGTSSYYGGFAVYNLKTKKITKRITLKDQPKRFLFLENGNIVMRGHKFTRIYDSNWNQISKHNYVFEAIHPSGEIGIYFNDDNKATIYNFKTKKKQF